MPCGAGRSVGVRSDEGIERIGDGHLGAGIARKSEFRELLEFRSNPRKLVDFPRWRSVVVEKSEQRLLFSADMAIEGPRQNRLRADQQGLVGVHTAATARSVIAPAAGGEFVEPDGRFQVPFGHQRTQRAAYRIAGIEPFRAIGHIRFVGAEIVEASSPGGIPKIRDRRHIGHIAPPNGIQFPEPLHRNIGPVAMQVQVAFGRSGPAGERQVDVFEAVEPPRPALCGPGFIEIPDRSVLRLQPGDEALPVRLRIGHEPVSDLVVVADGDDCGMVCVPFRNRVGEDSRFTDVVRIGDVVHVSLRGRYARAVFVDDVHARVCAMQPDRGREARNVDDDPDSAGLASCP